MSNWWDLYRASFPDDMNLAPSRETPGWLRGFFRGEDGIDGQAEFRKVDGRGIALISVAAGIALGVLGTIVVVKNRDRIKRWWEDRVISTAHSAWKRITRRQEDAGPSATVEVEVLNRPAHEAFSREIDVAIHDTRTRMSTAEAQRYLLAILLAASFIAEAIRKLSNARIEGGLPELTSAIKKLTTQQVTDAINQTLETSPSLLDDKTSSTFIKIFGNGQLINGTYAPLQVERVKAALRLRDDRRD
jgi:hypothetical protein